MTHVGTSTDPIHSTDTHSPANSPRAEEHGAPQPPSGGTPAPRRSLPTQLDGLSTLNSAYRGRRAVVQALAAPAPVNPSAPPPTPPHAAQPNVGYWTQLLTGEGDDNRDLCDDEPTTQHGGLTPPVADAPPVQAPASSARTATTRPPPDAISSEDLLAIARLAQGQSISRAAQACNVSDSLIYEFLGTNGLTQRGLRAAGDRAEEINRLIGSRDRSASLRMRPAIGRTPTAGPLADEIDRGMALRIPPGPLPPPMTAESLQCVVEAARNQSLEAAAQTLGRTLQQIDAYVAPWGLTHAGRWVAGERADALDEILYQRYLAYGGAGAIADGVTFPTIAPPAMRRRHDGAASAQTPHARRKVSAPMLAAVAQAATSEGAISRASEACGVNAGTISGYLLLRGLTIDGRAAAGNWAGRIQHFMDLFGKRRDSFTLRRSNSRADEHRAPPLRMPRPAEQEPRVPPASDPSPRVGVRPASARPLAPPREVRLRGERNLPPLGAERTTIDAIDLVAIARLSVTMSISDAAARLNISAATVGPFLSLFGLTPRGRALAGDYATEIDRFTASRLEHLGALSSELQAQGRSFASLQDDPLVRELTQMVGGMGRAGADERPTSNQPPVAPSTDRPTVPEAAQLEQTQQTDKPAQPAQLEQPEQSALPPSRSKKRQRAESEVGRGTRRRHAAVSTLASSPMARKQRATSPAARAPATAQRGTITSNAADNVEELPAADWKNKVTDTGLLCIAKAVARGESIRSAAKAERFRISSIRQYLGRKGLTARGKKLAGPHAQEIDRLMRKTAERRSTTQARAASRPEIETTASSSPARLKDVALETEDEFDEVMRLLDEESGGEAPVPASRRESASALSTEPSLAAKDGFDESRRLPDDASGGEAPSPRQSLSPLLNEPLATEDGINELRRLLDDDLESEDPLADGSDAVIETGDGATHADAIAQSDIDAMVVELTRDALLTPVTDTDDSVLPASDAATEGPVGNILAAIDFSMLDSPPMTDLRELPAGALEEMVTGLSADGLGMQSSIVDLDEEPMSSSTMSAPLAAMHDTPTFVPEPEESMQRPAASPSSLVALTPENPLSSDPTRADEQGRTGPEQPREQSPGAP
ncbi:hypothetical protein LMG24076_02151 [Trinickia soli]|nr:hypothetical protein LMG24076_02151 [Trinickia soli]